MASRWRIGLHDKGITRFVLDLSAPLPVKVQPQTANRVFIDLPGTIFQFGDKPPRGGLIAKVIPGSDKKTRRGIELLLTRSARIQAASLLPPEDGQGYRLVVDLAPEDAAKILKPPPAPNRSMSLLPVNPLPPSLLPVNPLPPSLLPVNPLPPSPPPVNSPPPSPPAVPRPKIQIEALQAPYPQEFHPAPPLPPIERKEASADTAEIEAKTIPDILYERSPLHAVRVILPLGPPRYSSAGGLADADRPVIAIDAGHGGKDPGATSFSGKLEKDIVLAYAHLLRERLEATGRYRVALTRKGDELLGLRDRVSLARHEGAALFVSIHADALADRSVSGMSVYTLSDKASDREAEALAAKENKAEVLAGTDLSGATGTAASILIAIAQRDSRTASRQFAYRLVKELRQEVAQVNNSIRSAGFAVLTAPDMPSVLLELGYLSNPDDEQRILSPEFQDKIAKGILRALDAVLPTLTGSR